MEMLDGDELKEAWAAGDYTAKIYTRCGRFYGIVVHETDDSSDVVKETSVMASAVSVKRDVNKYLREQGAM